VGKLLFLIIAAVVIYAIVAGVLRKRRSSASGLTGTVENMVNCARCGVNVPQSEAIEDKDHFFCSEEHRRLGAV